MTRLRAVTTQRFDQEQDERKRRRFLARLCKAGWTRMSNESAVYQHPDGGVFNADEYDDGKVAWRRYEAAGTLPPPASGQAWTGND